MPSSSIIWALEQAIFNELSSDMEIAANVVGIYHLLPNHSNRPFIYLRVDRVNYITTVLSSGYKVALSIIVETDSRSNEKVLNILERIGELLHHKTDLVLETGSVRNISQTSFEINRNDEKDHNVVGITTFQVCVE